MKRVIMKNPEMSLFKWRELIRELIQESIYNYEFPNDIILYVDAGRSGCQLVIKEKDNK